MYIGIVGSIGVGKTRLAEALAGRIGYRAFFEPVERNPYLDDFYANPQRYFCLMELFILGQRFREHLEIQELLANDVGIVQDQILFGDALYAKLGHKLGLMDDRDYLNYTTHFDTLQRFLRVPDVIVHLDASVESALQRIEERGRASEKKISADYIRSLSQLFAEWVDGVRDKAQVVRLDWNTYQPVDEVVRTIEQQLDVQLILPVAT